MLKIVAKDDGLRYKKPNIIRKFIQLSRRWKGIGRIGQNIWDFSDESLCIEVRSIIIIRAKITNVIINLISNTSNKKICHIIYA